MTFKSVIILIKNTMIIENWENADLAASSYSISQCAVSPLANDWEASGNERCNYNWSSEKCACEI